MKQIDVCNAYNQAVLETLPLVEESQAMDALQKAFTLFQDRGQWLSSQQRMGILERAAAMVEERRESLALTATQEGGKPLSDSLVEVDRGITGIKVAMGELAQLGGREIPMGLTAASSGRMAFTRRMPRGVVLAISAFNHPFNLIVHQVIPAVAAGCPVMVKPALNTPLSCRNLVDILHQAGLPGAWCQMMLCENPISEALVADPRIAFLSFIGSPGVGWHLRSKLAPGAACALEHGGAAPALIDRTADLPGTVALLTKGGFYHGGQVCVSVQRVIVHQAIAPQLVDSFTASVQSLVTGDPSSLTTQVGPLITPQEVQRVHSWVKKAVAGGAQLLCGGEPLGETCYAPTLLLSPPMKADVSTREIFGPVVCLYPYQSLDQAIELANSVDYAFQASIFSNDFSVILQAIERLQGRAIMVNDHTAFRVDWMPFGGYRQSGLGTGGIGHSLRDMTLEKMFVIKQ